MDPSTPVEPPPPAYEDQHEYDRKISDALQHSLHISQPSAGEDTWEDWDDDRFEAAARARERGGPDVEIPHRSSEKERLAQEDREAARAQQAQAQAQAQAHAHAYAQASSGPSSSTSPPPHGRTPSFGRRLPTSPPVSPPANTTSTKERPSWFAQAQLDSNPAPAQVHHLPPDEDEPDEQLPAFSAVGPPLEGPPFEEVMRVQPRPHVAPGDSPPQSPLDSVDGFDSPPLNPPAFVAPVRPNPGPRAGYVHEREPRVVSTSAPLQIRTSSGPSMSHPVRANSVASAAPRPPAMPFDPAMAYGRPKPRPILSHNEPNSSSPVDASAFYNSAVSSFLGSPRTPKKSNTLKQGHLSSAGPGASSYASRTSDPHIPRAASPFASRASDPYPLSLSSNPQGQMYQQQYPPLDDSFPPPLQSYPPQQQSYPPQQQSYPPQQQSYPSQQQQYAPQQQSYPSQQQSYFPQQPYPPQQQAYPQQQQAYHPQQQSYPQMYGAPAAGPGWASYGGPGS